MVRKSLSRLSRLLVAGAIAAISGSAMAHVWQIGWNANANGSVDFYGVSYHGGGIGGAGSVDDFSANPAGFVINGTNVGFDLGSVVNLNDCFGAGGTAGTCDPTWNALGLDGFVPSNEFPSDIYGKYASVNLDSSELAALGIGAGSNSVLLSTFANNVDWDGLTFASATVPINIVVPPPTSVPEPGTLALLGLAAVAGAAARRRGQQRQAAAAQA